MLINSLIFSFSICIAIGADNDASNPQYYAEDEWESIYGKIIHASVIFRHGDRSICAPYPTDPTPLSFWQDGLGQLTKVGKEREYELGVWFRQRYKSIFGDRYKHDLLLVNSSNVDRTLMSAELVLAGMFPPKAQDMWNKINFTWQPIPIHTIPLEEDYFIHQDAPCERYNVEVDLIEGCADLTAYYKEHEQIFNYVEKYTGYKMSSNNVVSSVRKMGETYDVLFVESANNITLPEWTKKVYPEPLREISAFDFALETYTHEMRRIKAGPILGDILQDKRSKIRGNFNQTIHLYSGHDSTLANIMSTLGVYNYINPPYSSSLLFELRAKDDNYYITILYRNSSEVSPYLLNITECDGVCTLDQFIDFTANLIPSDYYEECDIGFIRRMASFDIFRILIASSLLMLIVVFLFLKHFRDNRKRRYFRYKLIANEVLKTASCD